MPADAHVSVPQRFDPDVEVSPFFCWEDRQSGLQQLAAPAGTIDLAGQAVPDQEKKAAKSLAGAEAAPLVLAATSKGAAWGLRRLATAHTAPARGRQAGLARLKQQREQRRRCSAAQSNGYDKPEAPAAAAAKGALPAAAPMSRAAQRALLSATDVAQQPVPSFQGFTPGEMPCQVGGLPLPEDTEDLEADITSMQRGLEVRAISALLSPVFCARGEPGCPFRMPLTSVNV